MSERPQTSYWNTLINLSALVETAWSRSDCGLFASADSPEEIWTTLVKRGLNAHAAAYPKTE